MNKLRALIVACTFFVLANGLAIASPKTEDYVLPQAPTIVLVDDLLMASNVTISVSNAGSTDEIHRFSKTSIGGFGVALFLDEKYTRENAKLNVSVKRQFESNQSYTFSTHIFDVSDLSKAHLRSLNRVLNNSDREHGNDLEKISLLNSLAVTSVHPRVLRGVHEDLLRTHLDNENFIEVKSCSEKLSRLSDRGRTPYHEWICGYLEAEAARRQFDFRLAENHYRQLLSDLECYGFLPRYWEVILPRIRGAYAEVLFIHSLRSRATSAVKPSGRLMEQAIDELSRQGMWRDLADVQNIYSFYLENKGDRNGQKNAIQESIKNHLKAGLNSGLAAAWNSLSLLQDEEGQKNAAIASLVKAIDVRHKLGQGNRKHRLLLNLSDLFMSIGDFENARATAYSALDQARQTGVDRNIADAMHTLGEIELRDRNNDLAFDFIQASLAQSTKLGLSSIDLLYETFARKIDLARASLRMGNISTAQKTYETLDSTFSTIISNFSNGLEFDKEKLIYGLVGRLELSAATDDTDQFNRDLHFLEKLLPGLATNSLEVPLKSLQLFEIARSKLIFSIKNESINVVDNQFNYALAIVQKIGGTLDDSFLGPALARYRSDLLSIYLGYLLKGDEHSIDGHWNGERAFLIIDNISTPSLISSREASIRSLAQHEGRLSEKLGDLALSIVSDDTDSSARENRSRYSEQIAFASIQESRKKRTSLSTYQNQKIDFIQARLGPDDVAIRYFIYGENSYVFIVTQSKLLVKRIHSEQDIQSHTEKFLDAIMTKDPDAWNIGRTLSSLLGLEGLPGKGEIKKLVIATSAATNFVPFTALSAKLSGEVSWQNLSTVEVIRTHSLSEYYSDKLTEYPAKYESEITVFANPTFTVPNRESEYSVAHISSKLRSWSANLSPLPWTGKEAEHIQASYQNKSVSLIMGKKATRSALVAPNVRLAKLLHIATHGYFSETNPSVVGLATAISNGSSRGYELFTLTDLLLNSYMARLVVISGCETLLGTNLNGEGVSGLSRGFLSRGSGSVISTLWAIPDRPTAYFMKKFYYYLKESDGKPSVALLKTKKDLSLHGRYKHPWYWSGFVLTSVSQEYENGIFD